MDELSFEIVRGNMHWLINSLKQLPLQEFISHADTPKADMRLDVGLARALHRAQSEIAQVLSEHPDG